MLETRQSSVLKSCCNLTCNKVYAYIVLYCVISARKQLSIIYSLYLYRSYVRSKFFGLFWNELTYKINVKFLEITNLTGGLKGNFSILNLYTNITYFPFSNVFAGSHFTLGTLGKELQFTS